MPNYSPESWSTGDLITSTKLNNIENGLNNLTIAGTTNQVLVNGATTALNNTAITLTLPQSIAADSTPTFAGMTLSAQLSAAVGTVGAPGIAFTGSLTSGLYRSAADQIAIAIAGAQVALFAGAGITLAQQLVLPVGAVGTPSFGFTGDLTTGIYHSAASQVAVALAGTKAALFTASGLALGATGTASGAVGVELTLTANDAGVILDSTNAAGRKFLLYSSYSASGFFAIRDMDVPADRLIVDANGYINVVQRLGVAMTPVRILDVTGTFGATGDATIGGDIYANTSARVATDARALAYAIVF